MNKILLGLIPVTSMLIGGCGITINAVETVSDVVQSVTDITSTTSGALDGSDDESAKEFVAHNYDTLSSEAARGGGSAVDSLAELLGENDSNEFSRWLQMHYDEIFSSEAGVLERIQFARHQVAFAQ